MKTGLEEEWEKIAPRWIDQMRNTPNETREIQLDPPVIELCGDVAGKTVVDLGCGEGRFSRKLVGRGVERVLGLDRSPTMIAAAKELAGASEEYLVADVEDLLFLEDASFDLAVSYLNQCDLQDFEANTREVFRILKPGGRFVVANLHPMRSATGLWCKDEKGNKLHAIVDRYFDETERHWTIMEVRLTNFHRTLETYLNGYLKAGFALEKLVEPSVTTEEAREFPDLDDELRVPNFIVFGLRKPGNSLRNTEQG